MLKHLSVSSSNSVQLHLKISRIGNYDSILLKLFWSGQFPVTVLLMQLPVVKVHLIYHTTGGLFFVCFKFLLLLLFFLYGLFHVLLFGNWKEENPRGFWHTLGISVISPCHLVVGDFQRTIVIAYIRGVERKGIINMSRARDNEKKSESPKGIETMTFRTSVRCSNHWAKKDSWRMGHFQGSCMICVLRTARISNVEIAICVVKWRTMVNFKLGEEMRNDVINMSRARDNEKIWVPDRNWTSFLHRPYNLPSLFLYQRHFLGKADYLHVCAAPTAKTTSQEPYYLCFV